MKQIFSILILLSSFLHSEEKQATKENSSKEKSCRLIYLHKPANAPDEAYLFDGKVSHKVTLPAMNFSQVVKLPGGKLTLGMTPKEVSDPKNFPASAPTIHIAENVSYFYLIVTSDPANKVLPVKMLPIDTSSNKLSNGQTLWLNFSSQRIVGKLGEQPLEIPAGSRKVTDAPIKNSGYFKAQFAYIPKGGKDFLPIMSKSWWHDQNSKYLGFIIDTEERLPRVYTFRDYRNLEAEEEAADNKGSSNLIE